MKENLKLNPNQIYVIGAADFWMQRGKWRETAGKRAQRVRAALERKSQKWAFAVIERALRWDGISVGPEVTI